MFLCEDLLSSEEPGERKERRTSRVKKHVEKTEADERKQCEKKEQSRINDGYSYSPLIAGAMRRSAQDGLFLGRPTNEDSVCFPVFFSLFMVFSVFFSLFMVFSVFDGFPIFCLSVSSNFPKLKFFKF
jgi:hypothetical protein